MIHVEIDEGGDPPLDTLATVECDDSVEAVELLVNAGRVPQDRRYGWARVVLNTHSNGVPRQVVRVAITPQERIPLVWQRPDATDCNDDDEADNEQPWV